MLNNLKTKGTKIILKAKETKFIKDLKSISENRQALKYGLPIIVILLLVNTIQVARFSTVIGPLTHYSEGLVDDLGNFRQDISSFGDDLNEMRSFLLLPTKDYSFTQRETETLSEDQLEKTDTEQALYLYLGEFVSERKTAENIERARSLVTAIQKNEALLNSLREQELTTGKLNISEAALSFKIGTETENYFEVLGDLNTGDLNLQSALGSSTLLTGADEATVVQEILTQTKKGKETIDTVRQTTVRNKTLIEEALKNDELIKLFESKKLGFSDEPEIMDGDLTYTLQNQDGEVILTLAIGKEDGKIRMDGKEVMADTSLSPSLITAVNRLDGTTVTEKRVLKTKAELENILKEEAFKELLSSGGLIVAIEPREAYNQLLYDVTNGEGTVQFSFVIELSSGTVKVLKNENETDLLSVLEENAKKKL